MELLLLSVRARLRRGWLRSLAIVMLIGVVGGFVIAAAATARRVDVAYQALLSEIDAPDLLVFPECRSSAITGCTGPPVEPGIDTAQLTGDEAVERVRPVGWVRPYLIAADGSPMLATADNPLGCFDGDRSVGLLALEDAGPREQALPFRLTGDLPRGEPGGAVVTRATADRVGLDIGDGFTVAGWCTGDGDLVELSEPIGLVVTGVSIGAFDVEPPGTGQTLEPTYVDRSVLEALYAIGAARPEYGAVWLRDDSEAAATRELDGHDVLIDLAGQTAIIDEALDADARPLWILAAAGAVIGMLLLAPIIDRSVRNDASEAATLSALGASRRQIALTAVSHIVVVAAAGGVIAIAMAPMIAAVLPMGLADSLVRGDLWFDALVVGVGAVTLMALVAACAMVSAWRLVAGRRSGRPVAELTTDRTLAALRLPPPTQMGVMAALGRPAGPRVVSPWPGLVSLFVVCTVCIGALTYWSGLRNLEQSPDLLGWNWDAVVTIADDAEDRAAVVATVEQLDGVEQATAGTYWPPVFLSTPGSDLQVWPWSFATGSGAITPTMVEGRAPDGPDEVAIDLVFRDVTGLAPGDTVQLRRPSLTEQVAGEVVRLGDHESVDVPPIDDPPVTDPVVATFEITGIAVLPGAHTNLFPQASLTLAGLAEFVEPSADEVEMARAWLPDDLRGPARDDIEAWLSEPGIADRVVYVRASGDPQVLRSRIDELDGVGEVIAPRPLEVVTRVSSLNLSSSDEVPVALAVVAGVAALSLLAYLVATGMWARRTELAILRAMGLSSWGVRSSLAAQATFTVLVVLAVAVPVGVVIGQRAWMGYADDLLVVPEGAVSSAGLGVLVVAALVVVNVIALLVAQLTVGRSAARELRAE
jgi:hypothetical protein